MAGTPTENYTGNSTNVLIAKEGSYGASPGSNVSFGMLTPEVTTTPRNSLIRTYAVGSRIAQALNAGKAEITGSVTGDFQIGRFLYYAMGSYAKTGAGPYTHTFSVGTSIPSFQMLVSRGNSSKIVETYSGCAVNAIRFNGTLDEPLKVSSDFVAKNVSVNTSSGGTASFDSDTVQVPQFGTVQAPDGTAMAHVQNFEFAITNNIQDVYAIGARTRRAVPVASLNIDWKATIAFTDTEGIQYWKDMTNDTSAPYTWSDTTDTADQSLKIIYTNSGATTAERSITFDCVGLRYDEMSLPTKVGELTLVDISGQVRNFDTSPIVTVDNNNLDYSTGA